MSKLTGFVLIQTPETKMRSLSYALIECYNVDIATLLSMFTYRDV
jgi:hypothetical protein